MGVKQPTHSICPISVEILPDLVKRLVPSLQRANGGWLMAEPPAKAELWRQLGYGSFREWRLAVEKQRHDAAKAARIDGTSVPTGAAPSPAAVPAAPAPEAPTRKRRPNHSPSKTDVLLVWFDEHVQDPYPSPKAKRALASNAGLDVMQVETCTPLPSGRAPPSRARAPRCTSLPARHRVHESKEAILAILAVLRFSSSRGNSSSSSSSSSRCRRCR